MHIKREIRRLINCAIALLSVVGLLTLAILNNNSTHESSIRHNLLIHKICEKSFEVMLAFVQEKTEMEIALNKDMSENQIKAILLKHAKVSDKRVEDLLTFAKTNMHLFDELKFFYQSIKEFSANIKISRKKIIDDLSREKKILSINDWSIFTYKILHKFKNDFSLLRNKNYFSDMNFYTQDILINVFTEYTMHNILMYKNIKDYLGVLTANTSYNTENDLANINNIIKINKIQNHQINNNYKSLLKIYRDFKGYAGENKILSDTKFGQIVDAIITHIKFLHIQENAYLRSISEEGDNSNQIFLFLGIVLTVLVLVFCVLRYVINLYKFSRLENEDIAKDNYNKLGFLKPVMEVAKEYVENFSSLSKTIDVTNILPITSINEFKKTEVNEYVSDNAFNDICLIVKEINLCNSKIFENIKYLKEKSNSLYCKRQKLCDIANYNLKNDIYDEMSKCMNEIDDFYKLDAFESANSIAAVEFSYLFEKFHALSFKADNVKNIFLELVSEIKLLTLNSAIENTDSKMIAQKLQKIIDNVISKINVVKMFSTEANNAYDKTNKLLASLLKTAREIENIQVKLEDKISMNKDTIKKFFHHFKTICTHYELILGNSNIEQTEIDNFKKVLMNIKLQIENTNTKVNSIITNVEENANNQYQ